MTDLSRTLCRPATRGRRARTAARVVAVVVGIVLVPLCSAQADWESDYHQGGTYWGLKGNVVFPNFGSKIGQESSRPYFGVDNVSTAGGGLQILFGYRVHPYIAWEVAADWATGVNFDHAGGSGSAKLNVFTGAIQIKGYPLAKVLDTVVDGRIQPYAYVAPGLVGATGTTIKTPLHFGLGLGGGVDVWINESWSVNLDGKYNWSFGTLNGLDFGTLGVGGAYHF